jgi:hypothetical protein
MPQEDNMISSFLEAARTGKDTEGFLDMFSKGLGYRDLTNDALANIRFTAADQRRYDRIGQQLSVKGSITGMFKDVTDSSGAVTSTAAAQQDRYDELTRIATTGKDSTGAERELTKTEQGELMVLRMRNSDNQDKARKRIQTIQEYSDKRALKDDKGKYNAEIITDSRGNKRLKKQQEMMITLNAEGEEVFTLDTDPAVRAEIDAERTALDDAESISRDIQDYGTLESVKEANKMAMVRGERRIEKKFGSKYRVGHIEGKMQDYFFKGADGKTYYSDYMNKFDTDVEDARKELESAEIHGDKDEIKDKKAKLKRAEEELGLAHKYFTNVQDQVDKGDPAALSTYMRRLRLSEVDTEDAKDVKKEVKRENEINQDKDESEKAKDITISSDGSITISTTSEITIATDKPVKIPPVP